MPEKPREPKQLELGDILDSTKPEPEPETEPETEEDILRRADKVPNLWNPIIASIPPDKRIKVYDLVESLYEMAYEGVGYGTREVFLYHTRLQSILKEFFTKKLLEFIGIKVRKHNDLTLRENASITFAQYRVKVLLYKALHDPEGLLERIEGEAS